MRLPDLTDRMMDLPVRALRTVFAGIGRILLAADQTRRDERDSDHGDSAAEENHDPLRTRARAKSEPWYAADQTAAVTSDRKSVV